MSRTLSNESPPKTSESPTRRGTTSDKEEKSRSPKEVEKSPIKAVPNQKSGSCPDNNNKTTDNDEKTNNVKTSLQGLPQEKQKKSTGIWCDNVDSPIREIQKTEGATQVSDCTQANIYHTADPRTGYLQVYPAGVYPMAASSNSFPTAMNFPQQPFQESNRNNEQFLTEEQRGGNMMLQNDCKSGWRDEYVYSQANYPLAPQQFQMLPRSGNARSKNNYNNMAQGNYVQPRTGYADKLDKPSHHFPPHMPTTSQPGVYSHNYFQDPGYNVRSPSKGYRPAMQNYGKKEIERQRVVKTPARYYPDPREAVSCKGLIPTSEEFRFNYPEERDPRFGGNRQYISGSPKYPNDMRYTDGTRSDYMRYLSPQERSLDHEIVYPPLPYHAVDQNPVTSIRYHNPPGYPSPAEYKPYWQPQVESMFTNQDKIEHWPATGLGVGSVPAHLNITRPGMDFQRISPGGCKDEARARQEQPYNDTSYQVTRVLSNDVFDSPCKGVQKRPMPNNNQPPMMPPMMSQMLPQMTPSTLHLPPTNQGMPPHQKDQQNGPNQQNCYGVIFDEIDSTQPAKNLRRCGDFSEKIKSENPQGCDKNNSKS